MSRAFCIGIVVLLGLSLLCGAALAEGRIAAKSPSVTIILNPSVPSPSMLGTPILWTATVQNAPPGELYDYQFSVALQGQNQIVRDFNTPSSFTWVPFAVEGTYTVSVVVRDITQQPYIVYPPVSAQYVMQPWVTTAGGSAVNPTTHPLVALFSAGPCTVGHSIRVRFQPAGVVATMTTNAVPCSQNSANFLVAGMRPSTKYQMHWEEFGPGYGGSSGPTQNFTTGPASIKLFNLQPTLKMPPTGHDAAFPVVLFELLPAIGSPFSPWPTATDLYGNVIWYYPAQVLMTRMEPGGIFFTVNNTTFKQLDLAGNEVLETNVGILNEQLAAKGYPQMSAFNTHEARIMPNGNFLLLGSRDETSTVYQGGTQDDPVDIIGDMILVLDHNMQLVWAWDAFAHQDLSRAATMGDLCYHNAGGCPAFLAAIYDRQRLAAHQLCSVHLRRQHHSFRA